MAWEDLKRTLAVGTTVRARITRHQPFGVFVDFGYGYEGLIQITDFKDKGRMTPDEYPGIGTEVQAKVLGFRDHNCQVWLGVKPSQLKSE